MSSRSFLGEFEHMVLLAVLRRGNRATGVEISRELDECCGRSVSRGALYTTLERLRKKGLLDWTFGPGGEARGGQPKRFCVVSAAGIEALRTSRAALVRLWAGSEHLLGEPVP